MAIVWPCPLDVKTYAAAGRDVAVPRPDCPSCQRPMTFWSGYDRAALGDDECRIWIRRAKCEPCAAGHALIPSFLLIRRLRVVDTIGMALALMVRGSPARAVARRIGVALSTVRDWWRRFGARARWLQVVGLAVVVTLGRAVPRLSADPAAAALEAVAAGWDALRLRLGAATPGLWPTLSLITGGTALATTTSPRYSGLAQIGWMPATS